MQLKPFNLTFDKVICNTGGDTFSSWNSIDVLLNEQGQEQMSQYVEAIESQIIANGIPVIKPRKQMDPFHRYVRGTNHSLLLVHLVLFLVIFRCQRHWIK